MVKRSRGGSDGDSKESDDGREERNKAWNEGKEKGKESRTFKRDSGSYVIDEVREW